MEKSLINTALEQKPARFVYAQQARAFVLKSNSLQTRRTYETHIKEFFAFHNLKHPVEIAAVDVIRWRDSLIRRGSRPATVATKLSALRSFFDYLREDGVVEKNPASTKLVPPPELHEGLAGRALTPKEVNYLLTGPARQTATGARDYALMLLMCRITPCVAAR